MSEMVVTGKAKGGIARAEKLTPEERKDIAQKAALARWSVDPEGIPGALCEGVLPLGDVELPCYVLKGRIPTRVFHRRGLAKILGMKSGGGNVFMRTVSRKGLGSVIPQNLYEKINNPIVFKTLKGDLAYGIDAIAFIELCDAIWEAKKRDLLRPSQQFLAWQAEIILRSSAKVGIIALIDEATGYIRDKRKEEYRERFREFIRNEFREYEREFPPEFYDLIYRIYNIKRVPNKNHPQFFAGFTRRYVYAPLANSNGAILEMLDEQNPVVYANGGRKYKMFQFLTDVLGLPALRKHLWKLIGIGESVKTKEAFQRGFKNAFPQVGDQYEMFDYD